MNTLDEMKSKCWLLFSSDAEFEAKISKDLLSKEELLEIVGTVKATAEATLIMRMLGMPLEVPAKDCQLLHERLTRISDLMVRSREACGVKVTHYPMTDAEKEELAIMRASRHALSTDTVQ